MIDVGGKRHTTRRAVAAGTIHLGPNAFVKVRDKTLPKGDCFPMAEIAGVNGAKQCANLLLARAQAHYMPPICACSREVARL